MSSSSGGKFSFAFGGSRAGAATSAAPAPKSNMEALLAKAKTGAKPPAPKKPIFGGDDDEDEASLPPPSLAGPSRLKNTATARPSSASTSLNDAQASSSALPRAARKAQAEALSLDANAFAYDEIYDQLKSRERAAELAKKAETENRKPKYIENFLASAQTRKLDRLRAEEKMLSLEREKEGGEFDDKEKFVTEGYKKQMEEVRLAEEEEKQREDALRKSAKGPGLTAFYKNMLDSSSAAHDTAVLASQAAGNSGPSLAVRPPPSGPQYEPEAEYDPFLAREEASGPRRSTENADRADDRANVTNNGKKSTLGPDGEIVEMNDEGEVVDKRDLLKAGLNITKKPKPELPDSLFGAKGTASDQVFQSKAVGSAATYQERKERERRRLAEQLKEEQARKVREAEERAREEEEAARRRREGDEGAADRRREARERFLARKRAREEGGNGQGDGGEEEESKKVKS